jgi:predicted aldo/keto reductase-like oxidoreductase
MLEIARNHGFRFDTVQMPLNAMDAHFRSFEHNVLPELAADNVGILAMKPMGSGVILESNVISPVECLHYTMSLPVSTVITGIDSMDILRQDLDAVKTFKPMSEADRKFLLERTRDAARYGAFETFKTTNVFDSTAQNPAWLEDPQ